MWISVHDSIDGPKLRDLYKRLNVSKFEATGILVYLWQWGLQNANKEGLLLNVDKEDICRYLHSVANGCTADEHDILDALFQSGWIDEVGSQLYLHDWETWQKEWYKYRERLKKDVERKRNAALLIAKNKEDYRPEPEKREEVPQEKAEDVKEETKKKKKRTSVDYTEEFETFWGIYPKRENKKGAFRCFGTRLKEGYKADDLIRAASNYADKCRKNHTETKFTLLPTTFLGPDLRFVDYLPKAGEKQKRPETGNPFDRFVDGENPFRQIAEG